MTDPIVGVYALKPLSDPNPNLTQSAAIDGVFTDLSGSGFNTLVLASFHVGTNGDIYWNNDVEIVNGQPVFCGGPLISGGSVRSGSLYAELPGLLQDLKNGNGGFKTLLASFGGGGSFGGHAIGYWDFNNIGKPSTAFYDNLPVLLDCLHLDGIDIDLETYSDYTPFTETVVDTDDRGEIMRWPARIGQRHRL